MLTSIRAYRMPKHAYSLAECEDAAGYDERSHAFAVADGASSSAESGIWAGALVETFLNEPSGVRLNLSAWWERAVGLKASWQSDTPVADGWWSDELERRGAYATFLGVEILDFDGILEWRAVCVGDSCLFHLRDGRPVATFPNTTAAQFDSTPLLVGTTKPPTGIRFAKAQVEPGDVLIAGTDAISEWVLAAGTSDPMAWSILRGIRSDVFHEFVEATRGAGLMEDDDVAVVRCEVGK